MALYKATSGQPMDNLGLTSAQSIENLGVTSGQPMGNLGATSAQPMENLGVASEWLQGTTLLQLRGEIICPRKFTIAPGSV